MRNEIRVFKLISGEEIVGKVVKKDKEGFVLEKVRTMSLTPTGEQGRVGMNLIPFMLTCMDGEIVFPESSMLCKPRKIDDNLEKFYLEQTSGLSIASSLS